MHRDGYDIGPQASCIIRVFIWAAIASLAFFLYYSVVSSRVTVRPSTEIKAKLNSLSLALQFYHSDFGSYPHDLHALFSNPSEDPMWNGPYLIDPQDALYDQWGYKIAYEIHSASQEVSLSSSGADGRKGTQDDLSVTVGIDSQ